MDPAQKTRLTLMSNQPHLPIQQCLLAVWRRLTTSDHVYYAATKHHSDAEVHDYFSPYESPHAAFVTLMTAIDDLQQQIEKTLRSDKSPRSNATASARKK